MRGVRVDSDVVAAVPLPRAPGKGWSRAGSAPSARVERALAALAAAYEREARAYAATQEAVAAAVAVGTTWARVGAVQGVTASAAQYRYRRHAGAAATT